MINRRGFLGLIGSFVAGVALSGKALFEARSRPFPFAWRENVASGMDAGLFGHVADVLSEQPIGSADVGAVESSSGKIVAGTRTSPSGDFTLSLPEGTYDVRIEAGGYVGMSRVRQGVAGALPTEVDFRMVPLHVRPEDEQRLYDAVVTAPESPLEDLASPKNAPLSADSPLGVAVPDAIVVKFPDGHNETMPLDDYLKGVVPCEMPSNWPAEALKAQAIAARSYAVAYYLSKGYICTTTSCQVYDPTKRASTTDQAVDATHGQVAVYNGTIISAFFFSRCNAVSTRNSENALAPGGPPSDLWSKCDYSHPWNYVAYCRAKPCSGHDPYARNDCGYYGHGVGVCQWGVKAKADSGMNYRDIITYYYTSVAVQGGVTPPVQVSPSDGALFETGDTITLTWSATPGHVCYAELWNASTGTPPATSGWTSATSWPIGGQGRGTYQWRVKARSGSDESSFTGYWRIVVSDVVLKTYFPRADKYSNVGP